MCAGVCLCAHVSCIRVILTACLLPDAYLRFVVIMQVGDKIQYIKIVEGKENLKNADY